MVSIFIIGTHHTLQHNARRERLAPDARENFKRYLREQSRRVRPSLLAEESCQDILNLLGGTTSNVQIVATELGIAHKFCDADREARERLGIPVSFDDVSKDEKCRYNALRENYWCQQIVAEAASKVLFVCGANHVDSFAALVNARGHESEVLDNYWGKEYFPT